MTDNPQQAVPAGSGKPAQAAGTDKPAQAGNGSAAKGSGLRSADAAPAQSAVSGGPAAQAGHDATKRDEWTLFEVFVRPRRGLSHNHVGSVHAPDPHMALTNARDLYTRRQEGVSIWVIPSSSITASSPDEKDSYFEPAADKIYRHPTFYDVPEGVQM